MTRLPLSPTQRIDPAQKVAFKPLRDGNPHRLVTVEECIELLRQMLAVA